MPYRATQNGWVKVKSSDKMWSTGGGNGKPRSIPVTRTHEQYNGAKRYDIGRYASQVRRIQYVIKEGWRAITNSSRNNAAAGLKWKWCSVVDVPGGTVKSNVIQNNTAQEPGILGPWIKVIGCGQTGDGNSELWHLRNQWTKMNKNRQI